MAGGRYYKKGDYYAYCDQCRRKFYASTMRLAWDGRLLCKTDWEPRHPLDFPRSVKEDPPPAVVRNEPEPFYVGADFKFKG